jgi:hypothetical protein
MLSAVWAAVVAAAAAFVIGIGVAIYVMLKAARLMTESSASLARLQEREDLLIERASAAIDRAGEQIAKTETVTASVGEVTASMGEVTASMADVTASMTDVTTGMTQLRGRMTELTPAAPAGPDRTGGALLWTAALVYGLSRALGLRWRTRYFPRPHDPVQDAYLRRRGPGARETAAGRARPAPVTGQRRAVLTGRRGGGSR